MVIIACISAEHGLFSRICKVAPIFTQSNTWLLGLMQVSPLNSIFISSAVFAGLTRVNDAQTDRPHYTKTCISTSYIQNCVHRWQCGTKSESKKTGNITSDSSGFFRIPTMRTASWVRFCDVLRGSDVIDCGMIVSPVMSGYASGGTTS